MYVGVTICCAQFHLVILKKEKEFPVYNSSLSLQRIKLLETPNSVQYEMASFLIRVYILYLIRVGRFNNFIF